MGLFDTYPVATLKLGYDKTLPIKTVKQKKPIDNLTLEYFVELPNGERLQKTYDNDRVNVTLDVGILWDVNEQKHHAREWGHETVAHFTLRVGKTEREKQKFGYEFIFKQNLPEHYKNLNKKATELLKILRQVGLSPEKSQLYLLISASKEEG